MTDQKMQNWSQNVYCITQKDEYIVPVAEGMPIPDFATSNSFLNQISMKILFLLKPG